jgi:uncharacterized protein (TIGR00156 family)
MKYIITCILFWGLFGTASAQYVGNSSVSTIEEIKTMNDEDFVVAEGFIINQVDSDEYIFSDETGEIRIYIPPALWQGREVDSETRLRIYGEFEKGIRRDEIDVSRFVLLQD